MTSTVGRRKRRKVVGSDTRIFALPIVNTPLNNQITDESDVTQAQMFTGQIMFLTHVVFGLWSDDSFSLSDFPTELSVTVD